MLFGMIARPRATSSRTNSGVISFGSDAPNDLARMLLEQMQLADRIELLVLADRDVFHLRRDHAAPRVVHLADVRAGFGDARLRNVREAHVVQRRRARVAARERRGEIGQRFAVAALRDPARAQRRQAGAEIDARRPDRCTGRRCRTPRTARSSRRRTCSAYRPARSRASARGCRRGCRAHRSCANPESGAITVSESSAVSRSSSVGTAFIVHDPACH